MMQTRVLVDHLRVYGHLVRGRLRSELQYRVSFVLLFSSQAVVTGLEFAVLIMVVDLVPTLGQWQAAEVAFLYGMASVPFALSDVFVSPVETTSRHVREGTMDQLLLRPVSPLVQLAGLEFELRRAGKAVPPVAVLAVAMTTVEVAWTPAAWALVVTALVCGTVIYGALWVMAASVAFWAVASTEAANAFTYGGQFANQYPLHLYRPWIRVVLGWAVPLAFVAYVPTQRLLDTANPLGLPPWLFLTTPVAAVGVVALAGFVWRLGLIHYQSTGS